MLLELLLISQSPSLKEVSEEVVKDAHLILGKSSAPIKIVVFDDPDCPFCRKYLPMLKTLYEKNSEKVAIYVRYFPLDIHPDAERKSRILACSKDYFSTKEKLIKGMEVEPDVKGCDGSKIVERDRELGFKLGVRATPTSFIITPKDTVFIEGAPPNYDVLKETIAKVSGMELE